MYLKRISGFISIFTLVSLILGASVFSVESKSEIVASTTRKQESQILKSYLQNKDINNLEVLTSEEKDVSGIYKSHILEYIHLENYEGLETYLLRYDLQLSYSDEEVIETSSKSIASTVRFTREKYVLKSDSTNKVRKEWTDRFSGVYRENSNGTLTAYGSPTLSISRSNFGAGFSETMYGVSTGVSKSGTGLYFYGSYSMKATFSYSFYTKTYYFGNHSRSYTIK